jgi:hypothetical protein
MLPEIKRVFTDAPSLHYVTKWCSHSRRQARVKKAHTQHGVHTKHDTQDRSMLTTYNTTRMSPSFMLECIRRKKGKTTTPNRIRKWSPTLLLTGRYPGYLRRSDGMRSFLDSMVVDEIQRPGRQALLNKARTSKFLRSPPKPHLLLMAF